MFIKKAILIAIGLVIFIVMPISQIQGVETHEETYPNRTAIISEEVIRQKLLTYGVTEVLSIKLQTPQLVYVVQAKFGQQTSDINFDAVTGSVINQSGKITSQALTLESIKPIITGSQVSISQAQMVSATVLAAVPKDAIPDY